MNETASIDSQPIEPRHFGHLLKEARENRDLPLGEVARITKVSKSSLQFLEEAALEDLPPEIFVRGFVKSYARTVGLAETQPLALLDEMLEQRRKEQEEATGLPMAPDGELIPLDSLPHEEDVMAPKKGVGLAIFVVIVLVIATVTVSFVMRQPPSPGEGLSYQAPLENNRFSPSAPVFSDDPSARPMAALRQSESAVARTPVALASTPKTPDFYSLHRSRSLYG